MQSVFGLVAFIVLWLNLDRLPHFELYSITASWSGDQWGLVIVAAVAIPVIVGLAFGTTEVAREFVDRRG